MNPLALNSHDLFDATHGLYMINDKLEVVSPRSFQEWVEWRLQADQTEERVMLRSTFPEGAWVSSVFLGWAFDFERPPLYFETMTFDAPNELQMRATTLDELVVQHKVCLAAVAVALHTDLENVHHEGRLCISQKSGLLLLP